MPHPPAGRAVGRRAQRRARPRDGVRAVAAPGRRADRQPRSRDRRGDPPAVPDPTERAARRCWSRTTPIWRQSCRRLRMIDGGRLIEEASPRDRRRPRRDRTRAAHARRGPGPRSWVGLGVGSWVGSWVGLGDRAGCPRCANGQRQLGRPADRARAVPRQPQGRGRRDPRPAAVEAGRALRRLEDARGHPRDVEDGVLRRRQRRGRDRYRRRVDADLRGQGEAIDPQGAGRGNHGSGSTRSTRSSISSSTRSSTSRR